MTRLLIALLATTVATPALAQHIGHAPPAAPTVPAAACTAEHAAMGHCTPAPPISPGGTCTPEHAAMGHCTPAAQQPGPPSEQSGPAQEMPPQPTPDPHAGHQAPARQPPTADPHAGHQVPPPDATQAHPHAGHQAGGQETAPPAPPVAPPPPGAFSGPENAADPVFESAQMQDSRRELRRTHGRLATSRLRAERLELGFAGDEETYGWEADFFYGQPLDRLWMKTEGEGVFGEALEHGEVQVLWSHAISPFFDLQPGLRHDFGSGPDRAHLVLGLQGLAPYWIELDASAFLSDEGELTARIEAEHDLRVTQKLILQPLLEVELSAQDIPELGIGAGLSTAEAGLRLRYELVPEFAPYVGLRYERAFGDTARFSRAAGDPVGGWNLVIGVRTWF